MCILGINTAIEPFGFALCDGESILDSVMSLATYESSENCMFDVDRSLKKHGKTWTDLRAVYVIDGPGSYTGLRIGLSFSKTVSMVYNIPLYRLSALHVLAFKTLFTQGVALSVVKARKKEFNVQLFSHVTGYIHPVSKLTSFTEDELVTVLKAFEAPILVVGAVQTLKQHADGASPVIYVEQFISGSDVVFAIRKNMEICAQDGDYRKIMPQYSHVPVIIKQ